MPPTQLPFAHIFLRLLPQVVPNGRAVQVQVVVASQSRHSPRVQVVAQQCPPVHRPDWHSSDRLQVSPAPFLLQVPALHVAPVAQARPQPPQWLVLVMGFTQAPAQQVRPAPHALPHAPQLAGSVCKFTHVPPQVVWPVPHAVKQTPPLHDSPARHALPHMPQLLVLVLVLVHAPAQQD